MSVPRYPKYKESGVEWLDEVPEHWDIRKVRRLCTIKKRIVGELGYDVLSITQKGIKVKDLENNDGQVSMDYSKYQLVEVGDFAMNHMDLLTGYVDISFVNGVTSPDYRVFTVRDSSVCNDQYLLYLFQMGYKNRIFFAYGQGSSQLGRWRLPTEQFLNLPFPLPPTSEQRSIAAFLNQETAKIAVLMSEQQQLIRLLKEKRQAIILHAVTKGLDPKVPLKLSSIEWIGYLPAHWDVKPLKRLAELRTGITPPTDDLDNYSEDGQYPWVRPEDLKETNALTTASKFLTQKGWEQTRPVAANSSLVCCIGTIGKVGFVAGIVSSNQQITSATFHSNERFFYFALCASRAVMEVESTGNVLRILNSERLGNIWFPSPPNEEANRIAAFLEEETTKIDVLMAEQERMMELLQERRSALISAAVTGKIDVRPLTDNQTL